MYRDEIVEEVRKTRENIFEKFDFDINKYLKYIYEKQKDHQGKIITKPFEKVVVEVVA